MTIGLTVLPSIVILTHFDSYRYFSAVSPFVNPFYLNPYENIKYYDAAADTPVAINYQQLDKQYPNSKFLLTIRDIDSWLKSWSKHDQNIQQLSGGSIPNWVKELRKQGFGQWQFNPQVWRAKYERHIQDVQTYFQERSHQLLVLNLCDGEGWKKLCPFLGKESPARQFPHYNKSIIRPFEEIKVVLTK